METKWQVPTNDGKTIYGVKNSDGSPKDKALFIVHGLSGHMYEYLHKRAADYFSADYDVYRFDLYGEADDARDLIDCTIQTHADDLNTVLGYFAHNYKKIFLAGHSYGGATIMLAQPQLATAASLWDPTFDAKKMWEAMPLPKLAGTEYYITPWGTHTLIGAKMIAEADTLDETACIELSRTFAAPVQVITAGDGYYADKPHSWHSYGRPGSIRVVVAGTAHCFHEGQTCDQLLQKAEDWFSKF